MNQNLYIFLAVIVCAACTFALRAAPFLLFSGKKDMPTGLRRLAARMPAAIIAVLVIYCLKGMPDAALTENTVTLISVAAVVALHLWKKNTLVSIAGGTVLYMALLRLI